MKALLIKQMEFEFWANMELLKSLKQANPLAERALLLFSHINSANTIWLNRLKEEDVGTSLFQERTLLECGQLLIENNKNWREYFNQVDNHGLEKGIQFDFPIDGTVRIIAKKDAIFHLTNHSSYHRGQIISLIKGSVETLPALGYVFFASKIV
jgi:uncharacterized damage-inducible protein DinB